MKQTLTLLLLPLVAVCCTAWTTRNAKPTDPVFIYGKVYYFGVPYKNANHLETRPARGIKLYIRPFWNQTKYIGPITDSVVSDSIGNFSVYLRPGHYSFITEANARAIGMTKHFDPAQCDSVCYLKHIKASNATFQVDQEDNVEVMVNLGGM